MNTDSLIGKLEAQKISGTTPAWNGAIDFCIDIVRQHMGGASTRKDDVDSIDAAFATSPANPVEQMFREVMQEVTFKDVTASEISVVKLDSVPPAPTVHVADDGDFIRGARFSTVGEAIAFADGVDRGYEKAKRETMPVSVYLEPTAVEILRKIHAMTEDALVASPEGQEEECHVD